MKKRNVRLAVCVALVLLIAAGGVYAAVNDWKLFDFYTRRFGVDISEGAQDALKQNVMGQRIEVGDVILTVQEAVADGRYLYLSAKAEPKVMNSAYLMGMGDSPADWMAIDGNYDTENRRSYQSAAREDQKRLIRAELGTNVIGHANGGGMGDTVTLADGSLRIIMAMELPTAPEETAIEAELTAYALEWVLGEGDEDISAMELQKKAIRVTLPITPPIAQFNIDAGGRPFPGTAALIDHCSFLVTPLSCYYEVAYTVVELEDKLLTAHSRNVLRFELRDDQGAPLPLGLALSGGISSEDDTHFVMQGSTRLEKLPQTLTLMPSKDWGAGPEDVLVLTIPEH
ncbi:MAG: DUF4179 domain-containing protein [Clostridia bacterium]|nr:DUF4179 domain-containing protein [Clostridia bacterium]